MIRRQPSMMDFDSYHKFSVVIPLIQRPDGYDVLFEVRASNLKQPGEICFPGGRAEAQETPWETASREACEELLIEKSQIEEAMSLDVFISPFDMIISPYVAVLKDYQGTMSPAEVAQVFTVPFGFFKTHTATTYECRVDNRPGDDFPFDKIPGGRNYPWRHGKYEVNFYEYEDKVIWGLTAKIMKVSVGLIESFIRQLEAKKDEEEK